MKKYWYSLAKETKWPLLILGLVFYFLSFSWNSFAQQKSVPYIPFDPKHTEETSEDYTRAQADVSPSERAREALERRRERRARRSQRAPTQGFEDIAQPEEISPPIASNSKGNQVSNITKVSDASGKGLYTMEYRDADIKDVIEDVAEITGRNFLVDPRVKGSITIISPTPIDADAVWQVFLSALNVRGYATVENKDMTRIVPLETAASSPLETYSGKYTPPTENFITRLYTPKYVGASEMATAIKPLISKRGDVQAYKQTNTVIITDTGANIRRVIKIFQQLDQEGSKEQLEVIQLRYANPNDVAEKIRNIYQQEETSNLAATALRRRTRRGQTPEPTESEGPISVSKVLPDDRTNSVIVVASDIAMDRIKGLIRQLDIEVKDPKGNIHVYYLEHARAEDLAAVLASLASAETTRPGSNRRTPTPAAVSARVITPGTTAPQTAEQVVAELLENIKITADTNTNSLVVTASHQEFEALKNVIKLLDIPRRQVFIEAVFMELDVLTDRNLGISLQGGIDPGGNPIFGATSFTNFSPLDLSTASLAGLSGLNAAGISGDTITLTLSDGTTTTIPAFGAVVQALETSSSVNILSTPNILTTDNEEAEIVVGQNVPFVTESGRDSNNNPIISVEREDVAITLRVTPHINEGDSVRLDVFQEITKLIPNQSAEVVLNQGPSTTKRATETTVVVQDQSTVVLGGLLDDATTVSESRVPFLGKIPIIGLLFKSTRRQAEKTNLLIFLTPYVINSPKDFKKILVKKIEERNNFIKRNYGWIQRREIRNSLLHHQKALLKISEEVEARRKTANKSEAPVLPERKSTPSEDSKSTPIYREEVELNDLLDTY